MKYIKIFTYVFLFCFTFNMSAYANDVVPKKLKIGLYYLEKSVNSVELSSDSNFEIGFINNDIYSELLSEPSNILTLKKDSEYHIQVEDSFNNLVMANSVIQNLNIKYNVYPAYDGSWKVYIGPYSTPTQVSSEIQKLKTDFPTYKFTSVQPSQKSIQVISSNKIKLIYSGADPFKIVANNDDLIAVNGRKYRGSIIAIRQNNSDMTIINEVSFNEYLYSVVPSEMPSSWHIEALKTQAVAARTYAVNSLINSPRVRDIYRPLGFDMTGTTEFQVYNGYSNESQSTKIAVDETSGQIIYHDNKPINAMFFSCSGGYTDNSENVWMSEIPYLKAVEDKYMLEEDIIRKSWEVTVTPVEIKKQFISQGIDVGDIRDISVTKYSPSGYAMELKITGTKGEKIYKKQEIRGFIQDKYLSSLSFKIQKSGSIGVDIINSKLKISNQIINNSKVLTKDGLKTLGSTIYIKDKNSLKTHTVTSDSYILKGLGAGHGVGMSQYGARGMAEAGFNYLEILKHYYTGVEVR